MSLVLFDIATFFLLLQILTHILSFKGKLFREIDAVAQLRTKVVEPFHVNNKNSGHYSLLLKCEFILRFFNLKRI